MGDYPTSDVDCADLSSAGLESPSLDWHGGSALDHPSPAQRTVPSSPDGHGMDQDVAIVGFSFVFPGAETPSELWDLMLDGQCVATEFPPNRLNSQRYHRGNGNHVNSIPCTKACFIERDVTAFDAQMFNMTAVEASSTDPQQRLLLETTYRALENAGISPAQIKGTDTSVHTGCFTFDYAWAITKDPEYMPKYSAPGGAVSFLSNRLSTFFDLTGPSVTVDTACSSSLVALDQACRCIRQGESSMGIVAGSSLLLTQDMFFTLGNMGFLSPDGVSHSFDSRGNGYGRGEGVAALILKPVSAALRDGDTIRAVIRNTCTNQNGLTPLAVPSKQLQQRLIRKTYHEAAIDMSKTMYVEAHGTGTAVGDPLEAMAIGETFSPGRSADEPIIVGAIKANIGHLEGAAGIAGVIKTILVLERGLIPPIAELDKLNDNIDAEFLKLHFPRRAQQWPKRGLRRASVNSFGFGGTNGHAVLDDAKSYLESRGLVGNHYTVATGEESVASQSSDRNLDQDAGGSTPRLFVISGYTQRAVTSMVETMQAHVEKQLQVDSKLGGDFLAALAHTLANRRSVHSWRASVTADTVPDLITQLALAKASATKARSSSKVGFIFTGQGAQWIGMGRELAKFPVFRESVVAADSFLRMQAGCTWSAADILFCSDSNSNTVPISEPRFAQPLCTILQIALIELLRWLGVSPSAVVGHSSGEIAAAYAAGAVNCESAWKLAYYRGLLSSKIAEASSVDMEDWPRGSMMAVGLSEEAVRPHLDSILEMNGGGILCIACINSPRNVTISGDVKLVEALQVELQQNGVFARLLKVPVAYHSKHMERLANEYLSFIGTLHEGEPQQSYAVMVSSITGANVSGDELRKADYWVRNLVSTVRFSDAVSRLCRNATIKERKKLDLSHRESVAVSNLLELGPHAALQGPIREIVQEASTSLATKIDIAYTSALVRGRPATTTLLEAMGRMHCAGSVINLTRLNSPSSASDRPPMVLPTLPQYIFDHSQAYWYEPRVSRNMRTQSQVYSEFLGAPVADYNPLEPCWRNMLRISTMPWIADHAINGEVLFPAAGMIVMAVEAMAQISQGEDREIVAYEIRDMRVLAALTLPAGDSTGVETQLRLKLSRDPGNKASAAAGFTLFSISGDDVFTEVCNGTIKIEFSSLSIVDGYDASALRGDADLRRRIVEASTSFESQLEKPLVFQKLLANGYQFGPTFQGIEWTRRDGNGQSISMVGMQEPGQMPGSPAPSIIHPAALDRVFHTTLLPVVRVDDASTGTWVPTFVSKVRLQGTRVQEDTAMVLAVATQKSKRLCVASAEAMGGNGCIVDLQGIELTMVSADELTDEELSPHTPEKRLCFDILYKPDIDLLDAEQVADLIQSDSAFSAISSLHTAPLQRYVELLAHKNPGMMVLQIGANSQLITNLILSTVVTQTSHGASSRFSQYNLTDCEQEILDNASYLLDGVPKAQTSILDVETHAATQDSPSIKYDLVVVTSQNIVHSLANIRKFVKDDGKVIIIGDADARLKNHELLQTNDFKFVLEFDAVAASHGSIATLLMPSTPPSPDGTLSRAKTAMLITGWERPALHSRLAKNVIAILTEMGITETSSSSFNEVASLLKNGAQYTSDLLVIVVQDGDWLSLEQLGKDEYADFHAVLTRSHSLLWLGETTPNSPAATMPFGAVHGLARALRVERHGMIFATAGVDTSCAEITLQSILTRSLQNFLRGVTEPDGHVAYERELLQIGTTLQIPRVSEAGALNKAVHETTLTTAAERRVRFGDQNLKLKVRRPGLMDSLCLEEVPFDLAALAPHEIEVEVRAVGVNFRDCLIALGRIDQQDLGIECAGVVRAVGEDCTSVRPGDRVLLCQADSFVGRLRCPDSVATRIPESMSFVDAGALPTIFVTAWHGLVRVARLARGESILIHSGAGGTGQAAIQVALHCGAEVYTTVGTTKKRKLLAELYGIPPERILNSRDLSFADDIKRLTNGKGVDVVLNSLAGDALVASWECVAPWGRFLEIGKKDILSHNTLPMFQFKRNVSFSAIDVSAMIQERPDLLREALIQIIALIDEGVLRMPAPLKVFAISEAEQAFRYLQSGMHAGKVVVEIKPDDAVTAFVKPQPKSCVFDDDKTYLIAGGLGAQGKVIAEWMVDKGARHLVLLSRSGGDGSEEAAAFVKGLQSRGVSVYCPPCSIASSASLEAVLGYCTAHMPPLKGCIQAAMDLRDSIFENMTSEAWVASLQPKISGTWNLHRQLPADLDFFVMLSSVSGIIGSPGQSNYAAGNTFQDSLARHRVRQGKKAMSLDFSLMAGHGYAVENRDAAVQFIKTRLVMEMTQAEIFAMLNIVCDKDFVVDENHAQIVMGLELPAHIAASGMDAGWLNEPLFSHLHQMPSDTSTSSAVDGIDGANDTTSEQQDIASLVAGAASLADASNAVAVALADKLCRVLSLDRESFSFEQPLHVYGVDSLIAVEIRNWFQQKLRVDLAVFEILGGGTVTTLGRAVVEKLELRPTS